MFCLCKEMVGTIMTSNSQPAEQGLGERSRKTPAFTHLTNHHIAYGAKICVIKNIIEVKIFGETEVQRV